MAPKAINERSRSAWPSGFTVALATATVLTLSATSAVLLLGQGVGRSEPSQPELRSDSSVPLLSPFSLSAEEQAWVRGHPVVRVHLMTWPPFKVNDDIPPQGMTIDYLKLIQRLTGLEFQYVKASWTEALKRVKERRGIDVLPLLTDLPLRRSFMNFTRAYVSFPIVIFTRKEAMFVGGMDDLRQASVAVERDFAMHYRLQRDLPQARIHVTETTRDALFAVASGKVDAYLGNLAVGSYLVQDLGLSNLKVAAPAPYGTHIQAMGVRSDWPVLARLLDRALGSITHRGHFEIRQRWLGVRYEHGLTWKDLLVGILSVALLASLGLLGFWLWNRGLKREVESRRKVEAALMESQRMLMEAQRLARLGSWHLGNDGRLSCAPQVWHILGREAPERPSLEDLRGALEEESRAAFDQVLSEARAHARPFEAELWLTTPAGERRFIVCRGAPAGLRGAGMAGDFIGTCQDITDRKRREEERAQFEARMQQVQKLESLGTGQVPRFLLDSSKHDEAMHQ